MSYELEIIESPSNILEISSSVGNNTPNIEIIQSNNYDISISDDFFTLTQIRSSILASLYAGSGINLATSGDYLVISQSGNYALLIHNHLIADVSGLQTALDGKQPSGSYAALSHNHLIADVSGLQVSLDSKQPLLNNPIIGVGNSGYIARWTSNNTIDSGLIYDDSSVVYIRNLTGATATSQVSISGYKSLQTLESSDMGFGFSSINFKTPSRNAYINFYGSNTVVPAFQNKLIIVSSGGLGLYSSSNIFNPSFSISESGNIGIGKYNASVALDVIGTGNFSQNLLINNVPVSISGHSHVINDVSGLQTALDNKQPSGSYAPLNHSHSSSNITDFNSSVSGVLPVKNLIAGTNIEIVSTSGNYTISVSGLSGSTSASDLTSGTLDDARLSFVPIHPFLLFGG
jgi:hypothetical protein